MPVSISFVVPVLNEAANIERLLSELRQRFAGAQVLVVDGGSTDNTAELVRHNGATVLSSPPGRAVQMNRGAAAATGEYVFFLHADSVPTVCAGSLAHYLATAPQWGFCCIRLNGERFAFRVIEWFINQRSRLTRVATGDQMLFVRRELFDASGGLMSFLLWKMWPSASACVRWLRPWLFLNP